jgi:hypothetical protein
VGGEQDWTASSSAPGFGITPALFTQLQMQIHPGILADPPAVTRPRWSAPHGKQLESWVKRWSTFHVVVVLVIATIAMRVSG